MKHNRINLLLILDVNYFPEESRSSLACLQKLACLQDLNNRRKSCHIIVPVSSRILLTPFFIVGIDWLNYPPIVTSIDATTTCLVFIILLVMYTFYSLHDVHCRKLFMNNRHVKNHLVNLGLVSLCPKLRQFTWLLQE